MIRLSPALLLAGCASLQALPKDSPCVEAGYAISRRTFECTGDGDLANARFERFEKQFACIELPDWFVDTGIVTQYLQTDGSGGALSPPDYYHCAFAMELLPCELVEEYGDDLGQWLNSSNACAYVIEPKGGGR
jgi:hypothetical protein